MVVWQYPDGRKILAGRTIPHEASGGGFSLPSLARSACLSDRSRQRNNRMPRVAFQPEVGRLGVEGRSSRPFSKGDSGRQS